MLYLTKQLLKGCNCGLFPAKYISQTQTARVHGASSVNQAASSVKALPSCIYRQHQVHAAQLFKVKLKNVGILKLKK